MTAAAARPEKPRSAARLRRRLQPPLIRTASSPARRQAAAILEVLSGLRRPADAAQVLGVSLPRYYQLERRALNGLLSACEPVPRGPRLDLTRRMAALERENLRLQRECDRQRALVRAAERALGLARFPSGKAPKGKEEPAGNDGKPRRVRRPTVRALQVVRALQASEESEASPETGASAAASVTTAEDGA